MKKTEFDVKLRLDFDRLVVTGGVGFIGSHTVDALLHEGPQVWVLEGLSIGLLDNMGRWDDELYGCTIGAGTLAMNMSTVPGERRPL